MLRAVAVSDGKTINVLRRASLSRHQGDGTYNGLRRIGMLHKEISREERTLLFCDSKKMKRKKIERNYSIQDKIKFTHPFHRFWYTFIEPHAKEIEKGVFDTCLAEIKTSLDRYVSFTFEELSNALIKQTFDANDPIAEKGNYWDRHNEFDLLAKTKNERIIIGECKWKSHKICKSEVTKLKAKCKRSGIKPDYFALFSKSGFSKELQKNQDPSLLCFDINDFERLLR